MKDVCLENNKNKHYGNVLYKGRVFSVIDCKLCGFKHLNPIPSAVYLNRYYERKYYCCSGNKLLMPAKEARESKWMNLRYFEILSYLNKYVKNKNKRLLDIGCGNGFFLKFMKNNGWDVTGIEPSKEASRQASLKKVNVFNCTFAEFINSKQHCYFDAINLKNILEHLSDPAGTLVKCRKALKSDGVILVEAPNDFNLLQEVVCKNSRTPWWIAVPDHVNYFDFKSLEKLFVKVGFRVLHKTTDFPMELFLLMGEDYVNKDGIGASCHRKRMQLDLHLPDTIRRKLYEFFADAGMGRNCIFYLRQSA